MLAVNETHVHTNRRKTQRSSSASVSLLNVSVFSLPPSLCSFRVPPETRMCALCKCYECKPFPYVCAASSIPFERPRAGNLAAQYERTTRAPDGAAGPAECVHIYTSRATYWNSSARSGQMTSRLSYPLTVTQGHALLLCRFFTPRLFCEGPTTAVVFTLRPVFRSFFPPSSGLCVRCCLPVDVSRRREQFRSSSRCAALFALALVRPSLANEDFRIS